ncbi:Predicted arabinose efflux permease, MFS family [Nocardia amikacinitolerans]|uniref:Predicted arabinose efflux permease, MFS family n=1 Tax=Nocardia amikacinitolerans TaxID=756689 RepID=A0A285KZ97_9NOCA|nr:MFS transporter [Nocardia amikacinitolerans]SNY76686.1 Predicted arabinose efflux permease, MFS family [Nocardia amikacinitolerans]
MSDILIISRETRSNGLRRTLILALGTFAVGTDAFVLAGFLPDLAADLEVSTAAAGSAVTVFAAGYALGSPVLATVTARAPRRGLLVTALLVLAVANLGSALAPTFSILLLTRVLAAAGAAAFTPTAGAVAAALVRPDTRARALAVVVGGLTVATALGVPLGNALGQWLGWRTALAGVAALCLLAAAGVAAWVPFVPGSPGVPLTTRLSVLRDRTVAKVLPLTVLGMAAAYVAYAYAVPALGALGIGASSIAWMLCLYGIGAVAGNLVSGYATDRWGSTRVLTAGYSTMATALGGMGVLAATGTRAPMLVGALAMAWGAASWCQTPAQQHRLIDAAPQESGLVVALNASGIYLGIGVGTLLGGLTTDHGATTMFATGTVLAASALVYLRLTATATRPV